MIVMKFGGTSVADSSAVERLCGIVSKKLAQKPVIVVSALSRITNDLTEICNLSASGNYQESLEIISRIRTRHLAMCKELFGADQDKMNHATSEIDALLNPLSEIVKAVSFLGEISIKKMAWIIALGEQLSNIIVDNALNHMGIKCKRVDARDFIITDNNYLKAKAEISSIKEKTSPVIEAAFHGQDVVLTQGFIARAKDGSTSLLGREGSDLTATLIGMALGAEVIEIWTDVDGIRTTDPREVQGTKSIPEMSFDVAEELSFFGAKVLHPLTIQPARLANIPVKVLNSANPDSEGTLIIRNEAVKKKGIKSISFKEKINLLIFFSNKHLFELDFINAIFRLLSKYNIKPDIIVISESKIMVSTESEYDSELIVEEIADYGTFTKVNNKSQITIVGEELDSIPGTFDRIFSSLKDINIDMVSFGASPNNISFVVERKELKSTLQSLHDHIF